MGRLPSTTQFVSLLLVLITLAAWISSTLAETAGHRTGKLNRPRKIQVYQGDDSMFRCHKKFTKFVFRHSNVEWYKDGYLINRNIHQRLRFSLRRNAIYIDNVHSEDEGVWAVRPHFLGRHHNISAFESSSKLKSGTWCNFTLEVLEDPEDEELFSLDDGPQVVKKSRQDDVVDRAPSQTRPFNASPEFRRLERRKKPQLIMKRTGESVALKCPVRGKGQYSASEIDWRKNGEKIGVSPIVKKSGWSLKLKAITKQDSGEYICAISNLSDKNVNFTFQLTVLDVPLKPKLLGMQNITVRIGDTARLNCSMASQDNRLSTVEWLRQASVNSSNVESMPFQSSPFFEVLDVDYSGGKDRRILSIENVTHEDGGKYLCLVTNQYGKSVQSSWLIIENAKQTETLQGWFIVQISTAAAVGGAIIITTVASTFILIWKKCSYGFKGHKQVRGDAGTESPVLIKRETNLSLSFNTNVHEQHV